MSRALPHAIGFILPPIIVWSAGAGGAWTFLPVALLYGIRIITSRQASATRSCMPSRGRRSFRQGTA